LRGGGGKVAPAFERVAQTDSAVTTLAVQEESGLRPRPAEDPAGHPKPPQIPAMTRAYSASTVSFSGAFISSA